MCVSVDTKSTRVYIILMSSIVVAGNEGTQSDAILEAIIIPIIGFIGALCAPIIAATVGYKCK